jgi:hypothetical protein
MESFFELNRSSDLDTYPNFDVPDLYSYLDFFQISDSFPLEAPVMASFEGDPKDPCPLTDPETEMPQTELIESTPRNTGAPTTDVSTEIETSEGDTGSSAEEAIEQSATIPPPDLTMDVSTEIETSEGDAGSSAEEATEQSATIPPPDLTMDVSTEIETSEGDAGSSAEEKTNGLNIIGVPSVVGPIPPIDEGVHGLHDDARPLDVAPPELYLKVRVSSLFDTFEILTIT